MLTRTTKRVVINRYLTEEVYKVIKWGYLAIYKRPNLTCAEELEYLKDTIVKGMNPLKVIETKKYLLRAGHGGTLDSTAEGVLAVALCDGCKVLPSMLASSKRYTLTAQLGIATDTDNSNGKIIVQAGYDHVTKPLLEQALSEFVGEIYQRPPTYSALKIDGQRASDIARSGKEVTLRARPVECHSARCIAFDPPYFTLDVECGHGFYVRSLVRDLAEAVNSCAHITFLVRTKHGPFTVEDCIRPEHYSLRTILSAVSEARRKHPKLAQELENYWKNDEDKTLKTQRRDGQHQKQYDLHNKDSLASKFVRKRPVSG